MNHELLAGLAHLYVYGLIRVFYNPKGPTPTAVTADLSPRESFKAAADNPHIARPSSNSACHLRQLALKRDNYRCVFTDAVDMKCATPQRMQTLPQTTPVATTFLAHIISQSLSDSYAGTTQAVRNKFSWARTAGEMIGRFGGFSPHDILGDDNIQSPKNAFTSSVDAHALFDDLDLWLTPAKDKEGEVISDTYDVHHYSGLEFFYRLQPSVKGRVQFQSFLDNDQDIPSPDPNIIALHAACAQTAHISGAAEHLKEVYRDTDDIAVMTEPNAAYELRRVLKTLQAISATA